MEKYITFKEMDGEKRPRYYILQRAFPHFVAEVVDNPYFNCLIKINISRYKLFVAFDGTLRGNEIPSYKNVTEEIAATLQDMAQWYLEKRLIPNEKKYSKWKVQ